MPVMMDPATATSVANNGAAVDYYPLQQAHSTRKMFAQHMSAYAFAARQLAGRRSPDTRVLDAGCGQGYGTAFLADHDVHAVGVDLLLNQLTTARATFTRPALSYAKMNLLQLGLAGGAFDVACSFQVIEHIPVELQAAYLREIARVLKEGGVFCVSTLNRAVNMKSPATYQPNPDHTHEFIWPELLELLRKVFHRVEPYSLLPRARQRAMHMLKRSGLCGALPARYNPVVRYYDCVGVGDFVIQPGAHPRTIDLICLCRV